MGLEFSNTRRRHKGPREGRWSLEVLVNFLEVTDLGEYLLIVIKTSEGNAESSESLCKADVLKLIAPKGNFTQHVVL